VWWPMIGFEYEMSPTGSIRNAIIKGQPISWAKARQLLASRCFVDGEGLQIGGPLRNYWHEVESGILVAGNASTGAVCPPA
jgi:hypothetical protein